MDDIDVKVVLYSNQCVISSLTECQSWEDIRALLHLFSTLHSSTDGHSLKSTPAFHRYSVTSNWASKRSEQILQNVSSLLF